MTREQASKIIALAIAKPYSDEPPSDLDHAYAARLAQALDALGLLARRKTPRAQQHSKTNQRQMPRGKTAKTRSHTAAATRRRDDQRVMLAPGLTGKG